MVSGKLFFGIMFSRRKYLENAIKDLIKKYGQIQKESEEYNFSKFTKHYEEEMGKNILKKIIVFKKKISEKELVKIKHNITEIEKRYSTKGKRRVNIDPGLVCSSGVFLATRKNKRFKKLLAEGVYSHKVLSFEKGKTKYFFHTFKDYQTDLVAKVLHI